MGPHGEPFDPVMIVFAALAIFVVWRLRSVLGARFERDEPPAAQAFQRPSPAMRAPLPGAPPSDDVTPAPAARPAEERWSGVAEKGAPAVWSGLDAIVAADPRFDGQAFLDGARRAYEIIVEAFAKGDRDRLRELLSKNVFDAFDAEIARRQAAGETEETGVVAMDSAIVDAARAAPGLNEITVRFAVRLMRVRRDRDGEVIDGGHTQRVVESWTFSRDPHASNPNWRLVATKAEA